MPGSFFLKYKGLCTIVVTTVVLIVAACGRDSKEEHVNYQTLKKELIEANKTNAKAFTDSLNDFIKQQGWNMQQTGTGLRYMYLKHGKGDTAGMGMTASVLYQARLLDGTEVYSASEEPESFLIGRDDVVSGIHQGVAMMREGDRMRFVLPPHLAYGLTGDRRYVPPNSPMIYVVQLVDVRP